MKILCVEFENLRYFQDGKFKVEFFATDKVFSENNLYQVFKAVYTQNILCFIGLNATGKTTALRLLNDAMNIVIRNSDLSSLETTNVIQDGTILRITFFHNNGFYQLESVIGCREANNSMAQPQYFYREETLYYKSAVSSRKKLLEFDNAISKRSTLTSEEKTYLDDNKSIVAPVVKGNDCFITNNFLYNYINVMNTFGITPAPILELFDDSIEQLSMESVPNTKSDIKWNLKFKNESLIYNATDPLALNLLISTGTIRGQGLIWRSIDALRSGGYLIIDELELHLNKEIVRVILNLFRDPRTNPNGACLIFSTHYAEILDFAILDRKDNIYITRKTEGLLSASKFSNEFTRNDFKKSELILSNALSGTAPSYDAIQRLRDFVCKSL